MKTILAPLIKDFLIGDGFWQRFVQLVQDVVIPYQWDILNDLIPDATPSHCIENFRIAAGESDGTYYGMVFQDSDVAKWLEAVSYSLAVRRDPALEKNADEVIALIGRAQQPDGYLNTFYTAKEPGKRWTNLRDCHELYCAGHMMEAAVAYFQATGKRELLVVMTRMAEHIYSVIGPEEGKLHGIPGHQEIELALIRMYDVTQDPMMLRLASYFIDERGKSPSFFESEHDKRGGTFHFPLHKLGNDYAQNHLPVREQMKFEGHSVRALYMATGMANLARIADDETLIHACRTLFDNMVKHRMYITGGVGSTHHGEAFSLDDDLPNDTAYNETCASIALCFFAQAMLQVDLDSRYADAMELAMLNTVLGGMSLDGHNFFYVNPLEVWPEASHKDPGKHHVLPTRPRWFGCACCPPNLARFLMSLAKYAFGFDDKAIYVHQYIAGEVTLGIWKLKLETRYPCKGDMRFMLSAGEYAVYLRIPAYVNGAFTLQINDEDTEYTMKNGYACVRRKWGDGDILTLSFVLTPRRVYPNPRLREDVGRIAVMRGPLVYCLEEVDNGNLLHSVSLNANSVFTEKWLADELCGIVKLEADGTRLIPLPDAPQYLDKPPVREPTRLSFIPYYAWANRGENEMAVWLIET